MIKHKIEIDRNTFPQEIHSLLENAKIYDSSSSSNAKVYYADTGYYIKVDDRDMLAQEAKMGRLLYAKGLGVEVIDYICADKDFLITRSAIGEDLTHCLHAPEKLCHILASSLRALHCKPTDNVPVSSRYRRFIDSANGDYSGGYYDESVLMDRFRIHSKEEAWHIMQANKHLLACDTLIHGDACLPNIIQKDGRFSSFIDCNMAGLGDKHIDLYWAIWSLQYNLKTEAYTDLFLEMYGREYFCEDMLRVVAAFELFG